LILLLLRIFATSWDIPQQRKISETPIEILKKRSAQGEIAKKEYQDRRQTFKGIDIK
jgi:uncharacterized membrane protein